MAAIVGKQSEKGQSMAWTAVFLTFLLIPLLMMVADGGRLFHLRTRLQTATDAACESAAWSAADYQTYKSSGVTTFDANWYWIARAQNTFHQSLSDQDQIQYSAAVYISPDYANAYMNCYAEAYVPLMVSANISQVTMKASSSSRIRFRNAP